VLGHFESDNSLTEIARAFVRPATRDVGHDSGSRLTGYIRTEN
jgi:hypothetical protein